MKRSLCALFILLSFLVSKAQKIVRYKNLKYAAYSYHGSLNKSFINKRILFFNGKDSVIFNIKIPFDIRTKNIYDPGIFYNCKLKQDSIYSFELKKTTGSAIPKEYNSYYKVNGLFNDTHNPAKFNEVKKNTKYLFRGDYSKYVDINSELYEIINMSPTNGCNFQL
jgi:hypothetical protein